MKQESPESVPPKWAKKIARLVYQKRVREGTPRQPLPLRLVAKEIGVSAATISRLEANSKVITVETLVNTCKWLRIGVGEVFGEKDITE